MGRSTTNPNQGAPLWVQIVGSIIILVHLVALGALVLAAPSGPWFTPMGQQQFFLPPRFAAKINDTTRDAYLSHVRMTHNYHFRSIVRPSMPEIELEAKLKLKNGETKTIIIPDKNACDMIQQKQRLLVQWLAPDDTTEVPREEKISSPTGEVKKFKYWQEQPDGNMYLREVDAHLAKDVIQSPMVGRPSAMAKLVLNSYGRYLLREHDAQSVEFVRRTWNHVDPSILMMPQAQPFMHQITAHFGEMK